MPSRVVREGILTSERVNQLDADEEVFYRRLQSVVDDFGRHSASPAQLRAACYPLCLDRYSEDKVGEMLKRCVEADLVAIYEVRGAFYLEVLRFDQRTRIMRSKWPLRPDEQLVTTTGDKGGKCYEIKRLSNDGQTTAGPSGEANGQSKPEMTVSRPSHDGLIPIPIHTDTEGRKTNDGQLTVIPEFEPVKLGLYPREYEDMKKHARAQIEALKRDKGNYVRELRDDVTDLCLWLRKEGKPDYKSRIDEILKREDSYEFKEMKTIPATAIAAWRSRIKDIERVQAGIRN